MCLKNALTMQEYYQISVTNLTVTSDMSLVVRKPVCGVSGTNRAAQPQKIARGLNFRIKKVEGCGENKDAAQLLFVCCCCFFVVVVFLPFVPLVLTS